MSTGSSEFSRLIDPRKIDAGPLELEATEAERAALAKRFGLVAVNALTATIELEPKSTGVAANGSLQADIVQSCAVSGDDLPAQIEETIALKFVPEQVREPSEEEIELAPEELDEIEYAGDRFDLGEAVAQTLALAIDPFAEGPRADEVRAEKGLASDDEPSGPLAEALAALKNR